MPKERTYEELMGIATGKTAGFTGKQRLAAQKMLKTMYGPKAPAPKIEAAPTKPLPHPRKRVAPKLQARPTKMIGPPPMGRVPPKLTARPSVVLPRPQRRVTLPGGGPAQRVGAGAYNVAARAKEIQRARENIRRRRR